MFNCFELKICCPLANLKVGVGVNLQQRLINVQCAKFTTSLQQIGTGKLFNFTIKSSLLLVASIRMYRGDILVGGVHTAELASE